MRNEKLISAREERVWTQEKAAEKIGVSRVAYARWETASVIPHLSTISMACEAFKMTPEQLGFRKPVRSQHTESDEDVDRRKAIQEIGKLVGTMSALLVLPPSSNAAPLNVELWERLLQTTPKPSVGNTFDLDLVDNYAEALRRLLAKGEAQYVMYSSQNLYHTLIQEHSSPGNIRLAETQLRIGMLVGAAQEYTLPWYQREHAVLHTYNHIEDHIIGKFDGNASFRHEYAQLLAKRERQHRVLWQFETCEKECEDGLSFLQGIDDCSLHTHFLCESAHIEATRGDEPLWIHKLEDARKGVLYMDLANREKAFKQIDYMQGEGYKRFAFHTQKDLSISMREGYAKHALNQFTQWNGATIELPGFESLVAQVSRAQCLVLLDPDEAIHLARQLEKLAEHHYPALLDKIRRVMFLAQQRLQMRGGEFLQIFKEASHSAYHTGRNIL